jgi:zinc protease
VVLADAVYGGGGFGTRLNLNLREDKGYSYGVFSNAALLSSAGTIIASGGVQTDKTTESAVEFVNELKNFAGARPIGDTELTNARLTKVRGYAQQFESLGRVVDQVLSLWTVGLPMAELQQEPEKLMTVPLPAVNAAAKKYGAPSGATLLLVGDLSKIQEGIRKLNLGELVVLDVEGRPAK